MRPSLLFPWLVVMTACGHAAPPPTGVAPVPPASAAPADVDAATASAESAPETGPVAVAQEAGTTAMVTADAAAQPGTPTFDVSGPTYPADQLKATFEKNSAKLKACFEPGRKRNPKLRGRVIVKFTIGRDGKPNAAADQGSNLEDPQVIACVVKTVKGLRFPKPEEGSVTVIYPFIFHPTDPTLILPDSAK